MRCLSIMTYSQKELGRRIRAQRRKNKLTIEKLCEMLEVSPSFIGLVERGTSGVSLENLCKLSEIFQVSTDYLLKGEETNTLAKEEKTIHDGRSNIDILNTYLYNYTEEEIQFIIDLVKFLKPRISVK